MRAVNETLTAQGIALPLEGAATTTRETRLEAGVQAQVDVFGEGMRIFGGPGKRKAVTSTGGWRRTVSATGIPARDWISGSGN